MNRKLINKLAIIIGSVTLTFTSVYATDVVEKGEEIGSMECVAMKKPEVKCEVNEYELGTPCNEWDLCGVPVSIYTKEDTLVEISNKQIVLEEGKDYDLEEVDEGEVIAHINLDYMDKQEVGTMQLVFVFASGVTKTVEIEILPIQHIASVNPLLVTYDYNEPDMLVETYFYLRNNDLLGLTMEDKKLVYEEDFKVDVMCRLGIITFSDEFIKSLPEGINEIKFNFKETAPLNLVILVKNKIKPAQVIVDYSSDEVSNIIKNQFKLTVDSEKEYDLSKLKIRYYYTADGKAEQNVVVDHAAINYTVAPWYEGITNDIEAKIVPMQVPMDKADTYLEVGFTNDAILDNTKTVVVDTRINKVDWSNYEQMNDYSYLDSVNVCVYYDGELISGDDPMKDYVPDVKPIEVIPEVEE